MKKGTKEEGSQESSVRSSPRRKSEVGSSVQNDDRAPNRSTTQPTTPDRRSMTQRELKKLEDYWTRNNPVQEDSPRLRNNRKLKPEVSECLSKDKNFTKTEQYSTIAPQESSSIARTLTPKQINFDNETVREIDDTKNNTLGIVKAILNRERSPKCEFLSKVELLTRTQSSLPSQCSQNLEDTLIGSQSAGEIMSVDNDDYMPPRKKLRSEVTKDELWEGFPLTVSFKRLAPLSKQQVQTDNKTQLDDCAEDESFEGTVHSAKDTGHYSLETTNTNDIENGSENSLDSTINYANTSEYILDSTVNYTASDLIVAMNNDILRDIEEDSVSSESKDLGLTVEENMKERIGLSSCPSSKVTRVEPQYTPLKRSLRLQEKHSSTPKKTEAWQCERYDHQHSPPKPVCPTTSNTLKLKDQSETEARERSVDNGDETNASMSLKYLDEPVIRSTVNDEDLINKSLSQILSCDFGDSVSVLSQKCSDQDLYKDPLTCNEDSPKQKQLLEMLKPDYHASICETQPEHKSDVIRNPRGDQQPICSETKSDGSGCLDEMSMSCKRKALKEQRRSSRLAKLEKKKADDETTPVKTHDADKCLIESDMPSVKDITVTEEKREVGNNKEGEKVTDKKHYFKTKNERTKSTTKSVPPLRIKLKYPLQCLSRKKTSKEKSLFIKRSLKTLNTATESQETSIEPSGSADNTECIKKTYKKNNEKTNHSTKKKTKAPKSDTNTEHTQLKTKQKKSTLGGNASWSVNTNVELRLDNERRQSAVRGLLSNPKLDKHACVLWSSENRRHVQLSSARASPSKVDEILRRKWESLSDKEKIKYFQRARDAMTDENRHSNKRTKDEEQPSTSNNDSASPCLVKFLSLDSKKQNDELKQRLQFYREISPEEYNNVMSAYKESILHERCRELQDSNTKSKQKKSKRKNAAVKTTERSDSNLKYRRLLYEKICESWDRVVVMMKEKKEVQKKILNEKHKLAINQIIQQQYIEYCDLTDSIPLSQTLHDLIALEREKKIAVRGCIDETQNHEYNEVLKSLQVLTAFDSNQQLIEALDQNLADTEMMDKILGEIPEGPLPVLDLKMVEDHLCITKSPPRVSPQPSRLNSTSPTAFLNDLAVEHMLAPNRNVEFLGAMSLLTKKIVHTPSLTLTQYSKEAKPKQFEAKRLSYPKNVNNNSMYHPRIMLSTGDVCKSVTQSTTACPNLNYDTRVCNSRDA